MRVLWATFLLFTWWTNSGLASQVTCGPVATDDIDLVGVGHCRNADGLTATVHQCVGEPCIAQGDPALCSLLCLLDDGCTGFELRTDPGTGQMECFPMYSTAPSLDESGVAWNWTKVNGTQPAFGRSVVSADNSSGTCCYKRAYPRPCPVDNPIKMPLKQSARAKEIFQRMDELASAASDRDLPKLIEFIDYCLANATTDLFGVKLCPGMADVTLNGTLAPRPTSVQLLERFSAEV